MTTSRTDKGTRGHRDKGTARRLMIALSPCLLVALSLLLNAGCNVIGAIAYKASGDPTVPAVFPLPPDKKTLVLVENFHNPAALRLESDAVARHLAEELKMHGPGSVVEPAAADALRQSRGDAYRAMPIDAIGRALGAAQVIYVDLDEFEITHALASDMLGGRAEARVRVVDEAGKVLWPTDSATGHAVAVRVHPQRAAPGSDELSARRQLHAKLADRIAKLFYNWKADSADGAAERFSS